MDRERLKYGCVVHLSYRVDSTLSKVNEKKENGLKKYGNLWLEFPEIIGLFYLQFKTKVLGALYKMVSSDKST